MLELESVPLVQLNPLKIAACFSCQTLSFLRAWLSYQSGSPGPNRSYCLRLMMGDVPRNELSVPHCLPCSNYTANSVGFLSPNLLRKSRLPKRKRSLILLSQKRDSQAMCEVYAMPVCVSSWLLTRSQAEGWSSQRSKFTYQVNRQTQGLARPPRGHGGRQMLC